MRSRALFLVNNACRGNKSRAPPDRFKSVIKREAAVERIRLDDERMEWGEDSEYPDLVDTLKVGNISIPENDFKFMRDPAGWRGPRDKKHLKMIERMQKKEREHRLKEQKPNQDEHRRSLRVGDNILEKLNEILEEDIEKVPDPSGHHTIVSPVLHTAAVRFTHVEMTKDLSQATCTWECLASYETQVRDQLSIFKPKIRQLLTSRIRVKFSPRLVFKYNEKRVIVHDAERLMDDIEEEMREKPFEDDDVVPDMNDDELMEHFKGILQNISATELNTNKFEAEWEKITERKAARAAAAAPKPDPKKEKKKTPSKPSKIEDAIKYNLLNRNHFKQSDMAELDKQIRLDKEREKGGQEEEKE